MASLEELVRQTLAEDAQNGPPAAELIGRILREEPRPRRQPTRRSLAPLLIAAVVAVIATLALLLPRTSEDTVPAPSRPAPTTSTTQSAQEQYLKLSAGSVHITLPRSIHVKSADRTVLVPWSDNCSGLLGRSDAPTYACVRLPGEVVYEVEVGPGPGDLPSDGPNQRWNNAERWVQHTQGDDAGRAGGPPGNPMEPWGFIGGHPAILNLARGEVRYPCDGCSSLTWRTREWLTIYYPEAGGHITLVGPPGIQLENLVNFISIK